MPIAWPNTIETVELLQGPEDGKILEIPVPSDGQITEIQDFCGLRVHFYRRLGNTHQFVHDRTEAI